MFNSVAPRVSNFFKYSCSFRAVRTPRELRSSQELAKTFVRTDGQDNRDMSIALMQSDDANATI